MLNGKVLGSIQNETACFGKGFGLLDIQGTCVNRDTCTCIFLQGAFLDALQ